MTPDQAMQVTGPSTVDPNRFLQPSEPTRFGMIEDHIPGLQKVDGPAFAVCKAPLPSCSKIERATLSAFVSRLVMP
jgi:hypothetical protein